VKRYILIALILAVIILALQFANAHASNLRDFRDTTELEQFLEFGKMTTLRPDSCKENVDQYIKASSLNGYKVERYRISSLDYYKFWYNEDPQWQPNEGHGVALVVVKGKDYLIEPSIPMAWELTVPYAGRKVGIAWE